MCDKQICYIKKVRCCVLTCVVKLPSIAMTGWNLEARAFESFQVLTSVVLLGYDAMMLGK
jgi:hypothetical protein